MAEKPKYKIGEWVFVGDIHEYGHIGQITWLSYDIHYQYEPFVYRVNGYPFPVHQMNLCRQSYGASRGKFKFRVFPTYRVITHPEWGLVARRHCQGRDWLVNPECTALLNDDDYLDLLHISSMGLYEGNHED